MSELKTQENDADVDAFLSAVELQGRREDGFELRSLMERVTGCPARMWGSSIVGFDRYEYKQSNGSPGAWAMTGFSPRKANMVVYIMPGFRAYGELLSRMGRIKHSVSCLYFSRLGRIDVSALEEMIAHSVGVMRQRYPRKELGSHAER